MRPSLVVLLGIASLCHGETRRALLVGINEYLPDGGAAVKEFKPTALRPIPVVGAPLRGGLPKLNGSVNDAPQMAQVLEERFGFQAQNVKLLTNGEATADRILGTLKSFLVEQAAAGDVSLFYYAGHGSRMRNTKSDVDSKQDSTILAADASIGVPDIRGKELARIYRLAVAKHVTLTVIQDSCFSGSGARGLYTDVIQRYAPPDDNRYVEDGFTDDQGKPMEYPENLGVLVLSASQDYQPAAELSRTDLNGAHGVFTWALLKVLWSVSENERVDTIFERTRALMQTKVASQEPVMAGKGRPEMSLLGRPASAVRTRLIPVARVKDETIGLGAGLAMGLREGTELKRYNTKDAPVEIRITKVTGMNSAEAKVSESAAGARVQAGDMFQLDRWVAPDDDVLRVYFPRPAPAMAEIQAVARALAPLRQAPGTKWIEDPTVEAPDYVLSWGGGHWTLTSARDGKTESLGAHPTAAAVTKAMANPGSFFLLVPPAKEMLGEIAVGANTPNDAIRITAAGERPDYVLLGRVAASGGFEYAWALPDLTEKDLARQVAEARSRRLAPPKNAMPVRSKWVAAGTDAGSDLTDLALSLARVHGWIQLQPPDNDAGFPYHLAMENLATKEIQPEGETLDGEKYRLVLRADPRKIAAMATTGVPQRWVYVFVIDSDGTGQLIYPPRNQGSVGNHLPVLAPGQTQPEATIPLTGSETDITISAPFGVDTFYMLASEEILPDPSVLSFKGVRSGERGMQRGGSRLGRLLSSVGDGRRGVTQPAAVPLNWGLERHLFVSRAK